MLFRSQHGRECRSAGASVVRCSGGARDHSEQGWPEESGAGAARGSRGGDVQTAHLLVVGGTPAVLCRGCEVARRHREVRGGVWLLLDRCRCGGGRNGDDHCRAALLDCAMPCSASSRACQNRHGRVSCCSRLQMENKLATRCRRPGSTTFMKKV